MRARDRSSARCAVSREKSILAGAISAEERTKWTPKTGPKQNGFTPEVHNRDVGDPDALPLSVLRVSDNQRFLVHRLSLVVYDAQARGEITYDQLLARFPEGLHWHHALALAVGESGWLRTGAVNAAGHDIYMAVYAD